MNDIKQVSVIIAQYNPNFCDVKKTLLSVIKQQNIEFEVIIADDGSDLKYEYEIKEICDKNEFYNLKFSCLEQNVGTVKNIYLACCESVGKFIKIISPGDLFASENSLYEWYCFAIQKKADISFGDLIYYSNQLNNSPKQLAVKSFPVSVRLFRKGKVGRLLTIDYLIANDGIVGASILVDRTLFIDNLKDMVNKVIYAEDFFVRKAICEERKIIYYPQSVIWYEYGTGISTGKNSIWAKRIANDLDNMNQIIQANSNKYSRVARNYCGVNRMNIHNSIIRKIVKVLVFPEVLFFALRIRFFPRKSQINNEDSFYLECSDYK